MIDPLMLGVALAVVAGGVMIVVYFLSNKEDSFEKAFDENARRLLSDNHKEKPKQKPKNAKKKKEAAKADAGGGDVPAEVEQTEEKTDKKESPKKEESGLESADTSSSSVTPADEAPISAQKKSKKSAKNNKAKRDVDGEEAAVAVNQATQQAPLTAAPTPVVEAPKQEPVKEQEKKKPKQKKAHVNLADLDPSKVLTRLASSDDIELEYIRYLESYFHEAIAKTSSLEDEVNRAQNAQDEAERKFGQLSAAKADSDKVNHEQRRLLTDLTVKVQQLTQAENSQVSTVNQLRGDNDRLKKEIGVEKQAREQDKQKIEALTRESQPLQAKIHSLEKELAVQTQNNVKIVNELQQMVPSKEQIIELDQLREQMGEFEKAAHEIKEQLIAKNKEVDELRATAVARERRLEELNADKAEWTEKEKTLMAQYESLQALVEELNKEIARFETFKKEQDELKEKLIAKDQELEEKKKKLAEAEIVIGSANDAEKIAALESENAALRSKVDDLSNQLEAVSAQHAHDIASVRATADAANEEVVILKKSATLESAPSNGVSSDEVEKLKEENQRLQSKNDELRARNFTILENVNASQSAKSSVATEKPATSNSSVELQAERELVARTFGALANKKLNGNADKETYSKWVNDVSVALKGQLENKENAKETSKKDKKQKSANASAESDGSDAAGYRTALSLLTSELTRIEKLANVREAEHQKEVEALKAKLDKAQIDSLREMVTTVDTPVVSPCPHPLPPSTTAVRSDDSDWEVVSN